MAGVVALRAIAKPTVTLLTVVARSLQDQRTVSQKTDLAVAAKDTLARARRSALAALRTDGAA